MKKMEAVMAWFREHGVDAKSDNEVAEMFGATCYTVRRCRLDLGLRRKHSPERPGTAEARDWMLKHLCGGSKDPEVIGMKDVDIGRMFGIGQATVCALRHRMGIPNANERMQTTPMVSLKIGGTPMHYEAIGSHRCRFLHGLVRHEGYKIPTFCLCGLAAGNGEIARSRCNKTCKYFEAVDE
jgi:hypothetical protein